MTRYFLALSLVALAGCTGLNAATTPDQRPTLTAPDANTVEQRTNTVTGGQAPEQLGEVGRGEIRNTVNDAWPIVWVALGSAALLGAAQLAGQWLRARAYWRTG